MSIGGRFVASISWVRLKPDTTYVDWEPDTTNVNWEYVNWERLPVVVATLLSLGVGLASAQSSQDGPLVGVERSDSQEQPRVAFSFEKNPSLRIGSNLRFDVHFKSQADWRDFPDQTSDSDDVFDLHRARIVVDGRATKYVEYQVEREMRDDDRPWRDVFANVRPLRAFELQVGRFKVPFGLEQTTGVMDLNFAYRALASSYLAPGRDIGAMVHGRVLRNALRYEAGVFREGGDNARVVDEIGSASQRTMATRVVARPWSAARLSSLRNLEVGAAFTAGRVPEGLNSLRAETIPGDRLADPLYVHGLRRRLGAELQWRPGSASVQGEVIRVSEERQGQGIYNENLPAAVQSGWYLAGTWLVTGEEKKGNIDPLRPMLQGGLGAVEIAGRVEAITFGSSSTGEPPAPGPRAHRIVEKRDTVWTVGVNWYLNEFLRVQANVIREEREDGILLPTLGRTWSRTFRVQFQL
jgi:phosphate-selective porin OprO and OprP